MKTIYAAVSDLFFMAKMTDAAKKTGSTLAFASTYEQLIENIEDKKPDLVIVDLNGFLTLAHVDHIKSSYHVRILGYANHVQTDLIKHAKNVCDEVIAQSEFSKNLVQILSN